MPFFQPLELLWKLLEEWLVIIQVEFENSEPVEHRAKSPENQRMVSSAPPDLFETGSQSTASSQSNKDNNSVTSPTMTVHVTAAKQSQDSGMFWVLFTLLRRVFSVFTWYFILFTYI